ncbi:MAG TPA: sulfatase [Lentisphaeria bacterium]|nr:MAG: hypothetical protein A2X45_04095 [Lentisphaerae bacterium GWF2_50_93]HCE46228.1 sulfatase [Lentisphaeria bacterium]
MVKPNILLIITDQQNFRMMSCTGNSYLKTPAMDSIAARGVRFEKAYCTNPLCIPSRFSLMTGKMPSEIGLWDNAPGTIPPVPEEILRNGIGWTFRNGGYETVYGGKEHLPRFKAADVGFEYLSSDERDILADECSSYLFRKKDKPFFLVCSLINPHDICLMALKEKAESELDKLILSKSQVEIETLEKALVMPSDADRKIFFDRHCPPLPPNFDFQKDEPGMIEDFVARRAFQKHVRHNWSEEKWRMHRWAYCRLTEMADTQIGRVLDALEKSGHADNTVVVFTSDHGDNDSSHRLEHKSVFYEESTKVPFIISAPDSVQGKVDLENPVSNGLDIFPTLCDYAGISPPSDLKGFSLRPLVSGKTTGIERKIIPVEGELGRMAVSSKFKYALYDGGENCKQLYDLERDPWETQNYANEPGLRKTMEEYEKFIAVNFPVKPVL